MSCCNKEDIKSFYKKLDRRKSTSTLLSTETKLNRCLNTADLVLLGIGSTLGAGAYVIIGEIAMSTAGPAVIFSFALAAFASFLSCLCYCEFGARVPKAGSAYVYSYVTLNEIWAFIIGWTMILEYIVGAATLARALSAYIDNMMHEVYSKFMTEHLNLGSNAFSPYPDFLAFFLTIIFAVIVCFGIEGSSIVNSIFTIINLITILYFFICGLFQVNIINWQVPAEQVPHPEVFGSGGFFPYGLVGITAGAGSCFYCFVGFDIISTAGEETFNPHQTIPKAILIVLTISFFVYSIPCLILPLMVPYFNLNKYAGMSSVFDDVGWYVAAYIIDVGAIFSLLSCIITTDVGLGRIIYAVANDGLIPKIFAKINSTFKTPIIATLSGALIASIMAMFLDLKELVDMMSIGTLLAYLLVSMSVLLLRYEPVKEESLDEPTNLLVKENNSKKILKLLFNPFADNPNSSSFNITRLSIALICTFTVWASLVLKYLSPNIAALAWWAILLFLLPLLFILIFSIIIWRQPSNKPHISFLVPLVPFIPILSFVTNIFLMINLQAITWIRFTLWMIIGLIVYFSYGIFHSTALSESVQPESYSEIPGTNLVKSDPSKSTSSSLSTLNKLEADNTNIVNSDKENLVE